tara:strand:- start:387 stop:710 length:324 start_codon:yes stop_codon:yes gene_type:complete
MNRRQFIKKAAIGVTGAMVAGPSIAAMSADKDPFYELDAMMKIMMDNLYYGSNPPLIADHVHDAMKFGTAIFKTPGTAILKTHGHSLSVYRSSFKIPVSEFFGLDDE